MPLSDVHTFHKPGQDGFGRPVAIFLKPARTVFAECNMGNSAGNTTKIPASGLKDAIARTRDKAQRTEYMIAHAVLTVSND
jgi:hypothetical protein